jgi:hypothetical protein
MTWKTVTMNVCGYGLDLSASQDIIIGIVYSPPDKSMQEQRDLVAYLVETLDLVRNTYPECGIVLLGDFNNLDISDLLSCHDLSQVVTTPTRGSAILDLVITNIHSFYDIPTTIAPLLARQTTK